MEQTKKRRKILLKKKKTCPNDSLDSLDSIKIIKSFQKEKEKIKKSTYNCQCGGDIVIFEGTITLNKDFGGGYSYEVVMEKAKLLAE